MTLVRLALVALLGATSALAHDAPAYEVWAIDQGTNTIYVIGPDLAIVEIIALPEGIDMPHMISFTSDYAYAFIANVASGNVAVVRAHDREVIALLATGAGTHFAGVVPGDRRVLVDVIGERALVEIEVDLASERFTIGRRLVIADDPLFAQRAAEFPGSAPICHDTTRDGALAFVTLGPSLAHAGLVVLDLASFALTHVAPPTEIAANCGTVLGPDGSRVFLTGGSVEEGRWFVVDATDHTVLHAAPSGGTDAHGMWLTPGGDELWLVNRHSSDGLVIDPATFEVIAPIPFTGKSPDILTMSPDGRYAFVTLRGGTPRSGPHAIAGDTPGVAVLDVATRELVTIVRPEAQDALSDFHGIGVRPLGH